MELRELEQIYLAFGLLIPFTCKGSTVVSVDVLVVVVVRLVGSRATCSWG